MVDIAQATDGDVELTDDFAWAEPTAQHKRDLLLAGPGDFKETPTAGADCVLFLHDNDPGELLRIVRKQCQKDGMQVKDVRYSTDGELIIDAKYANNNH